jgi:hypothetical protein
VGASVANGAEHHRAGLGVEGLSPGLVKGVDMDRVSARPHGGCRGLGDGGGGSRGGRVDPIAIEGNLKEGGWLHAS